MELVIASKRNRQVMIAKGVNGPTKAGAETLTIRLTSRGRKLLAAAKRRRKRHAAHLINIAGFAPVSGAAVADANKIKLRP